MKPHAMLLSGLLLTGACQNESQPDPIVPPCRHECAVEGVVECNAEETGMVTCTKDAEGWFAPGRYCLRRR